MKFDDIPVGIPHSSRRNEVVMVRINAEPYFHGKDFCVELGKGTIHHKNEYHDSDDWEEL